MRGKTAGELAKAMAEWREHMHLRPFRYNGDIYITLKNKTDRTKLIVYHLGMYDSEIYFVADISYEERAKITSPYTDAQIISDMIMGAWTADSREKVRMRWEKMEG
jgi:SpoVK/Ycf46/Vps4 family AAA+-type ATPase